jgi:hypothetical protein
MNVQNFGTTKVPILGCPFGSREKKCHLDVAPMKRHKIYYKEGNGASSPKVIGNLKLVLEVVPIKSATSVAFNLH